MTHLVIHNILFTKPTTLKLMRKLLLFIMALVCHIQISTSQITYIGPFTGNQGGGSPLFDHYVSSGSGDMFIDMECFGSGTAGAGQGSNCRAIIRGISANADAESLIASDIICIVDGIYNGENGNNDRFFVNLNVCNLADGRYSVEIQCDDFGGDYDNSTGGATAASTWNYKPSESPVPYYTGTSGSCGVESGLDNIIEVGESGVAGTPQLEYFTVGDASVFRSMIVLNGLFLDMGKFQPGNPNLATSLNDLATLYDPGCVAVGTFPTTGFCGTDQLTIDGAEVNISKYTPCGNADVTGNRLYYRIYKTTDPAPAFNNFSIPFMDNCPSGAGTNFPTGGTCENENGILDQRWQTTSANIDVILLAPTAGTYNVEFYTETDISDCSGATSTVTYPTAGFFTTSFVRLDDSGAPCSLPVELTSFNAEKEYESAALTWETASEINSGYFEIERSHDGRDFFAIGHVEAQGYSLERQSYEFWDDAPDWGTNYYRLRIVDLDGTFEYSEVRELTFGTSKSEINIFPTLVHDHIKVQLESTDNTDLFIEVYDLMGRPVISQQIQGDIQLSEINLSNLSRGTYFVKLFGNGVDYSTKIIKL